MAEKRRPINGRWVTLCGLLLATSHVAVWAGSGRIELSQASMTPTGILITEPGSYVFTGNIHKNTGGNNGITVRSDHVTLNLNGFSFTSVGSTNLAGNGIVQASTNRNLRIFNGYLSGWDVPLQGSGENVQVHDLVVSSNRTGITVGPGALVETCVITENTGSASYSTSVGIEADSGSRILNCVVSDNSSPTDFLGVLARGGSVLSGCVIKSNQAGGDFRGIFVTDDSVVVYDCAVNDNSSLGELGGIQSAHRSSVIVNNTVKNMTSTHNSDGYGIQVGAGSVVQESSVTDVQTGGNTAYGIYTGEGSVVSDCTVTEIDGFYDIGIHASAGTVVAGCTVSEQQTGIKALNGSLVIENTLQSQTGYGIHATVDNYIAKNLIANYGQAAVHLSSCCNRVDENHIAYGINTPSHTTPIFDAPSTRNLIVRNTLKPNGPVSTNFLGDHVAEIYKISYPSHTNFVVSNPWANLSY